jgi:hypothetical protein
MAMKTKIIYTHAHTQIIAGGDAKRSNPGEGNSSGYKYTSLVMQFYAP